MNDCKTVTQVSRECSVSPIMLRYYEKLGLIESKRKEDYSYRIYDAETVGRIKMILLLRKLRVSLKDIEAILTDKKQEQILKILQNNIAELDEEIEAMDTIRKVLTMIVARYREEEYTLLADSELVEMIESLAPAKKQIQ